MRLWLALGGLNGFLSVAFGAYAAHGLPPETAGLADTGSRYQMIHALALVAVDLLEQKRPDRLLTLAGLFFTAGTIFFCLSLYAKAIFGLGATPAPLGGSSFMLGWAALFLYALRTPKSSKS